MSAADSPSVDLVDAAFDVVIAAQEWRSGLIPHTSTTTVPAAAQLLVALAVFDSLMGD